MENNLTISYLKNKYIDKLTVSENNATYIIKEIKHQLDNVPIDINDKKYHIHATMFIYNILNSPMNDSFNYSIDNLDIHFFKIRNNKNSQIYYNYLSNNEELWVFLETKTRYVKSNCRFLQNKLVVKLGLSQWHIDNDNVFNYLMALEDLSTNE